MTLQDRARKLAEKLTEGEWDGPTPEEIADAMVSLARDFAREALMSIYEVDDNDQHSSDGERARGSFRVRAEFCGRPNVERRHYRKEFNDMIEAAIAAAEKGESK